ncbi:dynein light chain Tctex-type 5-like [Montipora capricornis]|uniref:dynein light chain Tctex-type 5-like n=1 Tax=Montipora capricornis TaxID=246305 RepID=UPI0035F0FAA8
MSEIGSRSRSQSFRSSEGEVENSPRRLSQENQQQRRLSSESVRSYRKSSQQENTSRRVSGSRRISGASFFVGLRKPEGKEQLAQGNLKIRFENTYRLEPKGHFPEEKVRAVIKEALGTLVSHKYSATHSPFLAKLLSSRMLENVKQSNIERYKVVCLVTIGSKKSQGLRITSRCLWNAQFDTFVSGCFEGEDFFAVGTVYGVYCE